MRALAEAELLGDEYVATEHLMIALATVDSSAQKVLTAAALTYVAGFAMALAQFMNVLGIARSSDD